MAYTQVTVRFQTLSFENTVIWVLNCPEQKITPELDQKIISYVQKQKHPSLVVENIPLDLLEAEDSNTHRNKEIDVVYAIQTSSTSFKTMQDHLTLLILSKPKQDEDIVMLALKKFIVVILMVVLFSWMVSTVTVRTEL